jgi:hypothetical protein
MTKQTGEPAEIRKSSLKVWLKGVNRQWMISVTPGMLSEMKSFGFENQVL